MRLVKSYYIDDTIVGVDLDRWNIFGFFVFCENKVLNIDVSDLKDTIPAPVIITESKIRCACVSYKFLLTGHDEGNILIWDKQAGGVYKYINTFSQHKGTITNLVSINRPISQYGLNFNTNLEETIVKPLKKQNTLPTNDICLNKSATGVDYIDRFLSKKLKRNKVSTYKPQGIKSKLNTLDDSAFLKRKLNELYCLLNNH
jgi:hypothetical protein